MSACVLRGDWIRLHRRDSRLWVRERPYEVLWRTTSEFTVDDIQSVEIQARSVEIKRRRRAAATSASVKPAVTRVTIHLDADEPLVIDVHELEATVAEAFADLGDRLIIVPTIDLVAEHEADAAAQAQALADDAREDDASDEWLADAFPAPSPIPSEVSVTTTAATLDDDWVQRATERTPVASPTTVTDDELFPQEEHRPTNAGAWVRKRRKHSRSHRSVRG